MYHVKTNSALSLVKIKGFMTIKVPIVRDCYICFKHWTDTLYKL